MHCDGKEEGRQIMNNRKNQLNVFYNVSRFLVFHHQEYDIPTRVSLTTVLKYPRESFLRQ